MALGTVLRRIVLSEVQNPCDAHLDPLFASNGYAARVAVALRPALTRHISSYSPCYGPLGCGVQGCVYSAGEGRVVKITSDADEAKFATWLQRQGGLPRAMPIVYGAWRTPQIAQKPEFIGEHWYAIWREELRNVPDQYDGNPDWKDLFDRLEVATTVGRSLDNYQYDVNTLRQYVREALDRGDDALYRNATVALLFVIWLREHRVGIDDMHYRNWGWRGSDTTGTIVARDLGYLEAPRKMLPAAPGLSGFNGRGWTILRAR